jgi:ketosteroid isomerase-like protein
VYALVLKGEKALEATTANAIKSGPAATIETFIQRMIDQDLTGVVALYRPDAVWEVHVPSWDGSTADPYEMLDLHQSYFGRLNFRVVDYDIIAENELVALRWHLEWTDRDDGAPCASFQSHFFQVHDNKIRRHWMYCAGVRAYVDS